MPTTEQVLVVTVEGDAMTTVVPLDDPTILGQVLLTKINNSSGDGLISTIHAQKASRIIADV